MINEIYEFGGFKLDLREKRLSKNGQAIELKPKIFDVLAVLVERNGELVSHEELMELVWADTYVDESNLRYCIHNLRKALGNGFITTIPKRGYRLNADVVRANRQPIASPQPAVEHRDPIETGSGFSLLSTLSQRKALIGILLLIAAGALLLVVSWYYNSKPDAAFGVERLAVLPFTPIGEKETDTQAGLTDALITNLSKIKQFKVLPLNSVRKFVGRDFDALSAASELGSDAVLSGTYRFDDEHIRVTATLARTQDGEVLWTDTFTTDKKTGPAEIENSIALRLSRLISLKVDDFVEGNSLKGKALNPEAVEDYLSARKFWKVSELTRRAEIIGLYEKAVSLEPRWALAHSGFAEAMVSRDSTKTDWPRAEQLALKAIELDASLSAPHSVLGMIYSERDWNWSEAEKQFKQAIALDPDYAPNRLRYSTFLRLHRRFAEARAEIDRALELEPFAPLYYGSQCELYRFDKKPTEALASCRQARDLEPVYWRTTKALHWLYIENKMYDDLGRSLAGKIPPEILRAIAEDHDLRPYWEFTLSDFQKRHQTDPRPISLAKTYVMLGDTANALTYIEQALQGDHEQDLPIMNADPTYDPIRGEPRFVAVMQKIGMQN